MCELWTKADYSRGHPVWMALIMIHSSHPMFVFYLFIVTEQHGFIIIMINIECFINAQILYYPGISIYKNVTIQFQKRNLLFRSAVHGIMAGKLEMKSDSTNVQNMLALLKSRNPFTLAMAFQL